MECRRVLTLSTRVAEEPRKSAALTAGFARVRKTLSRLISRWCVIL